MRQIPILIGSAVLHPEGPHLARLRAAGMAFHIPPKHIDLNDPEQLIGMLGDAEATIAGSEPYTREVMRACPRLRAIVRCGVGYDNVDLRAADELGIPVTNTAGTNHEAVAEHAFAMMIALARDFPHRDRMVRRGEWRKIMRPRMAGRTLGLIGLGRSAQALGRQAAGFRLRVIATAPRPDRAFAAEHGVELMSFEQLLRESDFVSLHLPLLPDTRNLIDSRALALMKPGSILINTARGGIVDEVALHAALVSGHLAGAGLDVFAEEPCPPDHPLLLLDNMLVSPHVAGLDEEAFAASRDRAVEVLIEIANGQWPHPAVLNLRDRKEWHW